SSTQRRRRSLVLRNRPPSCFDRSYSQAQILAAGSVAWMRHFSSFSSARFFVGFHAVPKPPMVGSLIGGRRPSQGGCGVAAVCALGKRAIVGGLWNGQGLPAALCVCAR